MKGRKLPRSADGRLLNRRRLLAGGLGVAAMAGLSRWDQARANVTELTFATWGGDEIKSLTRAFAQPFANLTGTSVAFDGIGPTEGAIRAQVESGDTAWDVCDTDGFTAIRLGRSGHASAIDYKIVDPAKIMAPFALDHGAGGYTYSFVLAYDSQRFKDAPPTGWRDFWDLNRFPGGRAVYRWMNGAFEAAMMAEDESPAEIFPINIELATQRLARLGSSLITWETGAQARQLLLDGTASMACLWHSRAVALQRETQGRIAFTWESGILYPGVWVVPKGNPGGIDAFRLIAFMQEADRQIAFTGQQLVGPANPEATETMPANLAPIDPTQPANRTGQVVVNNIWWADNLDEARSKFNAMLSKG